MYIIKTENYFHAKRVLAEQNRDKGSKYIKPVQTISFDNRALGAIPNNRKATDGRKRFRRENRQAQKK